jgi:hypothetical protein
VPRANGRLLSALGGSSRTLTTDNYISTIIPERYEPPEGYDDLPSFTIRDAPVRDAAAADDDDGVGDTGISRGDEVWINQDAATVTEVDPESETVTVSFEDVAGTVDYELHQIDTEPPTDAGSGMDDTESAAAADPGGTSTPDPDAGAPAQPEAPSQTQADADWMAHVGDYDVRSFDRDDFETWGSLGSFGFPSSVSGAHMDIGALPAYDGESNQGLVFRRKFGDGALDPETGHRQMVSYTIGSALGGQMPQHAGHADEDGHVVANGVDGYDIGAAPQEVLEQVDEQEFIDQAAIQIILGNNDAHHQNVKVTPDGHVVFHDIDHSAGDITGEFVGKKTSYDDSLDRVLGELHRSAQYVVEGDESEVRERMLERAREIAQQHQSTGTDGGDSGYETFGECVTDEEGLKDDAEAFCASIFFGGSGDDPLAQALQAAVEYDPQLVQNVQTNIQALATGEI